ncbi:MAG TPA: SDR family oxidoreductase [Candidatus Binatia bacterium]|nr:SDR family oxidoreductase [Candidatus Binatia bacterium]
MPLTDKVCIVTGATSGVGRATAIELARRGATVAIVARDPERARATAQEVAAAGGGRQPDVFLADLGRQGDVRRVAQEISARFPAIHLLVNNAGVVNLKRTTTEDGIEATFAVNHLAYFLLTILLLDRLRAGAPARVVNVASDAHKFVRGMNFDDLGFERDYRAMRVYGHSKLANILFTQELARRLAGSGVTVNSVHPGAVATGLGKNNGRLAQLAIRALAPFFRSPEQGAATSLHVATAPELASVTGRYFKNCREAEPSRAARDPEAARRLWQISEQLVGGAPSTGD